jgi:tetratricopeptide (TPR) repeat protein
METNWFTRAQIIIIYIVSQLAIPFFSVFMLVLLLVYLVNFLYIQPNPIEYFRETYLSIIVIAFLLVFGLYTSFMTYLLNLLKFGKTNAVKNLIDLPYIVTAETKLYYYILIGDTSKSLEIIPRISSIEKKNLAKIMSADAYIQAKEYKKAEDILNTDINERESDLVRAKKGYILAKKYDDYEEGIKLILDAIEINRKGLIRNAEPKLLELNLILAELCLNNNKIDDAEEAINPWRDNIEKHVLFFKCKYSAFLASQYFFINAKILLKQNHNSEYIKQNLRKSITSFANCIYAKEAENILKSMK